MKQKVKSLKKQEKFSIKKEEQSMKKQAKGITLIALIITIIVLLILAAVSIATLTGDNGLLNKAQEAKIENDKAGERDQIQLAYQAAKMEDYQNTDDSKTFVDIFEEELEKNGLTGAVVTDNGDGTYTVTLENGNSYKIDENGNITDLGTGVTPPPSATTVTDFTGEEMYTKTENTETKDEYGNKITIPAGFRVVIDESTNYASKVTEGIVIEDNDIVEYEDGTKSTGNQFVWVPVGKIYTTADEATKESTAKTINLSRYEFADGTDKYQDSEGKTLALGTPIDRESSAIESGSYNYTEDTTEGDNTHAISITEFKNKTNSAGGYYIARYEASYGADGKANSKVSVGTPIKTNGTKPTEEGQLWNNINQPEAATASQNMYDSEKFTSDLVNSYAWDTAIVFIQTFGGEEYEAYSRQDGKSINNQLTNTGENGDNPLNINDMASNTREWTTETYSNPSYPCTYRGGGYNNSSNYTAYRLSNITSISSFVITFRSLLYV